ncbi:hypothetical protein SDC9_04148 [bioreactor metagenome]|uniref:Uncharacterized protein n=1 Tax=bioreactor metagenome TaxID=1076179 RepID=A0A644SVG7_9ZZZZ|nr:peptidylprolyl isomerase [Negativicutes bacterium]
MALDLATMLTQIEAAITAILGGAQEYAIGSRRVTKADLKTLLEERRMLIAELHIEQTGTTRAYARWPTR